MKKLQPILLWLLYDWRNIRLSQSVITVMKFFLWENRLLRRTLKRFKQYCPFA